jgi:hypothetical protein
MGKEKDNRYPDVVSEANERERSRYRASPGKASMLRTCSLPNLAGALYPQILSSFLSSTLLAPKDQISKTQIETINMSIITIIYIS